MFSGGSKAKQLCCKEEKNFGLFRRHTLVKMIYLICFNFLKYTMKNGEFKKLMSFIKCQGKLCK